MSENSRESSLLALLKLYDQLEARLANLEDQVAAMLAEDDGEPSTYMDGTPIK
jgi:hypothetical protein